MKEYHVGTSEREGIIKDTLNIINEERKLGSRFPSVISDCGLPYIGIDYIQPQIKILISAVLDYKLEPILEQSRLSRMEHRMDQKRELDDLKLRLCMIEMKEEK
jgi:hypothetical protein